MPKIQKKKFFEIDLPLIGEKYEGFANSQEELNNKTIKMDLTRQLRGKSVDMSFQIILKDNKLTTMPKKLILLPFFIKHMFHTGISYIEDSFETETKESKVIIKPFLITRKKVSRAVRRTLRNSARNWITDYLKTKEDYEVFQEILSNHLQKPLSLRLKKIYPLAICEIRMFEVKKSLDKKKEIGSLEIKQETIEKPGEIIEKQEINEEINLTEENKKEKKSTKKSKVKKA
jgi:ribosomal protein S3AE